MKKLLIALAVIAAIIALLAGVALYNLNRMVAAFLPKITAAASEAIGKPVEVEQATVRLFPALAIQLTNLKLTETPDALSAGSALLEVELEPLLRQEISVTKVEIDGAQATLQRDKSGAVSIGGIPLTKKGGAKPSAGGAIKPPPDNAKDPSTAPRLLLKEALLKNASLRLIDDSATPGKTVELKNIDIRLETLFEAGPGHYSITGSVARGEVSEKSEPPKTLLQIGELRVKSRAVLDPQSAQVELTVSSLEAAALKLSQIAITAEMTSQSVKLTSVSAELSGGKITAEGETELAAPQPFNLALQGAGVNLAPLLAAKGQSKIGLSGTLQDLNATAKGTTAGLPAALTSDASLQITNGAIEGINILWHVAQAIESIPGLEHKSNRYIPAELKSLLVSKNTPFDTLSLKLSLANSRITIADFSLKHSAYAILGTGSADFSGNADFTVKLVIPKNIVSPIATEHKNFSYALNEQGALEIPLKVKKEGDSTVVTPDIDRLVTLVARGELRNKAEQAVDKIAPKLGKTGQFLKGLF